MVGDVQDVIDDRYRIGGLIGTGGFARVFEGFDLGSGAPVAIKVMRERWRGDARVVGQFLNEARALRRVTGLAVPELHGEGQTDDRRRYIVMDRLRGPSLGEQLDVELPFGELLVAFRAVLGVLEQVHRRGVVHGDLKVNNILIADGDPTRAMLFDFGLARIAGAPVPRDQASVWAVGGTPEFMAPELSHGQPRTVASDVYAAGAILYELLTGVPPFLGASKDDVAARHRHDAVVPPSAHATVEIAPALDAIVLRALAKRPADRFPRAAELSHALAPIARIVAASGAIRPRFVVGSDFSTWRATAVREAAEAVTQV